ncbi:MAG: PIG-L family deacetylase [Lachnospiraceae bacterium]|nr:PIG-L family deacetylase [Lachnospiraceae bacterium]
MNKIVVVSPHVDDETLGGGGTLLKYSANHDKIYWINVTNARKEYGYTDELEQQGRKEIETVSRLYHCEKVYDLQLEPAGLHKYDISVLIDSFVKIFREIEPNTIMLPYPYDAHSDHRIVFDAAYTCTKTFRFPSINKVLCMEIISETDNAVSDKGFVPNFYVNIDDYLEKKLEILEVYKNEIGLPPFPRNPEAVKGLAAYRAAACNCKYAEAFRILKEIG